MLLGSVVCFHDDRIRLLQMFQQETENTDPQSELGRQCFNRYNEQFRSALNDAGDLQALQQLATLKAPNDKAAECLRRKIERATAIADQRSRGSKRSTDHPRKGNWLEPPDCVEA